jgi:hypothetical protein
MNIGARGVTLDSVRAPVLQEHGNRRGAAAIGALRDEWNVQPKAGRLLGR